MTLLSTEDLARLARAVEADHDRTGSWTAPARLLGLRTCDVGALDEALSAGSAAWRRLGQGDPYHLIGRLGGSGGDLAAVALVVHGWAFPPDDPGSWYGRPSQHPGRVRVRTVAVVTPDGRRCSVIRVQHHPEVIVDVGGQGPLLDALAQIWVTPPTGRAERPALAPARCRRDQGWEGGAVTG